MSVMCQNENGWIVDHNLAVAAGYKDIVMDGTKNNLRFKNDLFSIHQPFLMDSQFQAQKMKKDSSEKIEGTTTRKSRKRKRKYEMNEGEKKANEFHKSVIDSITFAYNSLMGLAKNRNIFSGIPGVVKVENKSISCQQDLPIPLTDCQSAGETRDTASDMIRSDVKLDTEETLSQSTSCGSTPLLLEQSRSMDNNVLARTAAETSGSEKSRSTDNNVLARTAAETSRSEQSLVELCNTTSCDHLSDLQHVVISKGTRSIKVNCINRIVQNQAEHCVVMEFSENQYIIPPLSTFLLSDYPYLRNLCEYDGFKPYDLIVLDPPWENKSAKRKKTYNYLCNRDFIDLPVPKLAADGCLVVVWVTNRMQHLEFITSQLFPAWSVQYLAKWFWLKVTTTGEMVYDILSEHKKPYEILVIGRYKSSATPSSSTASISTSKTIISVPSAVHSMKPPLYDVTKEFLPENPRCLELFARNLWPGWTSWGNEVIKHQHKEFYECDS